jgi:hypothetical protein
MKIFAGFFEGMGDEIRHSLIDGPVTYVVSWFEESETIH